MKNDDYTDVRNSLLVGLGLWAGAVGLGERADVFARLPAEVLVALVAFATAFATATVMLDARLRFWLEERGGQAARFAIFGAVAFLLVAGTQLAGAREFRVAAPPWPPLLLFVMPLTTALAVAASSAAWRRANVAVRRLASTAPGRRPAATSGSRTSARSAGAARARAAG